MPSTSETGHAKNVATFEDLISFCTGYDAAYNPTKTALQLTGLQSLRTDALAKLQTVKETKTAFDNATNARQLVFRPFKALSTRIINALAVSGADNKVVNDAKTINRKIQGQRATPKIVATATTNSTPAAGGQEAASTPTDKSISSSQQSYDSIIDHFTKLIQEVTQEPSYAPNETELKVTTLNTLLADMTSSNTAVINTYTAYSNARIDRDNLLYNPVTGLIQTALDTKLYIKSLFGAASPQYKQVSGLQFKQTKKA